MAHLTGERTRRRAPGYKFGRLKFLLRGSARCARCGRRLTAERHGRRAYYACLGRKRASGCDAPYADVAKVHRQVERACRGIPLPDSFRERVLDAATRVEDLAVIAGVTRRATLARLSAAAAARRARAEDAVAGGVLPADAYARIAATTTAQLRSMDEESRRLAPASTDARTRIGAALPAPWSVGTLLDHADFEGQLALLAMAFEGWSTAPTTSPGSSSPVGPGDLQASCHEAFPFRMGRTSFVVT